MERYTHIKIMKQFLILSTIIFVSTINLYGQRGIEVEYIPVDEGKYSPIVTNVFQDSDGLLWVGADDGLFKYNGYSFEKIKDIPMKRSQFPLERVFDIVEDDQTNLWMGTAYGVSKLNRKNNKVTHFNFLELFDITGDIYDRTWRLYIDSKKRLWAGTANSGLVQYNPLTDKWSQSKHQSSDGSSEISEGGVILDITEDKEGVLWAAGRPYGLVYYNDINSSLVPATIKGEFIDFTKDDGNMITALFTDRSNIIWITTQIGVYKYSIDTYELKVIKEYDKENLAYYYYYNNIMQDKEGNIWIVNNRRGILKFDGISDKYEELSVSGRREVKSVGWDLTLLKLMVDNTGIFWFSTHGEGIVKYDPNKEPFTHYKYDEKNKTGINSNKLRSLLESKVYKDKIYVGTQEGGLNLFDQKSNNFESIHYNVINDAYGGTVRSIFEEEDGALWLGTWGDGLIRLNSNFEETNRFVGDPKHLNSLVSNRIRIIKKGPDGNLWLATIDGLYILNTKSNKFSKIGSRFNRVYPDELTDIVHELSNNNNLQIKIDNIGDNKDLAQQFKIDKKKKYLVVSTGEESFTDSSMVDWGWIVDGENNIVWDSEKIESTYYSGDSYRNRIKISFLELDPGTYNLRYTSNGNYSFNNWQGDDPTLTEFWGIKIIEVNNESLENKIKELLEVSTNQLVINGFNIRSMHFSGNKLWLGYDLNGLDRINLDDNSVENYTFKENSANSISNNTVQDIFEDEEGILWLATQNGLNKFDPEKETFESYSVEYGLASKNISSILPGDLGELWISTRNGISKMITDSETGLVTFVNYGAEDGLGGTDFVALVALKTTQGHYYFGGDHGLNSFIPVESAQSEPRLVFSDILVSNNSVKSISDDGEPLVVTLFDLDEMELTYEQNDLTFVFAALHYSNPGKNQYAHKLDGYDTDWTFDNKREVTYTNLDPGKYRFSFKGSNKDGIWNTEAKTIDIIIHPPLWKTWWAYTLYVFFTIGFLYLIRQFELDRQKKNTDIKEGQLRAEAAELQAKAAEAQSKVIQVENDRKTKELEEARELQLSMLPKEIPNIENLDIAVYMKTATEVGGDYYDFSIKGDGSLNVCLGDATGHGMKAGTLVSMIKSLFVANSINKNLEEFFTSSNEALKTSKLDKMMMAFVMVNIKKSKIEISNAGIPPIYIYRKDKKIVEEVKLNGLPLGAMKNTKYDIYKSEVLSGDTIFILSDGFPELQNEKEELYSYERVVKSFKNVAEKSPDEIINYFKDEGSNWANDNDPGDDVTFVVIKVK